MKNGRRDLVLVPSTPWAPSEEQRKQVRAFVFNGLSEERIASILGITVDELEYHFAAELEFTEDIWGGFATERMMFLASQNENLGVAYRATRDILQTRQKRWRIPKDEPVMQGGARRIGKMSLNEVEQELAEMDKRRRAAASAPDTEGEDPPGS